MPHSSSSTAIFGPSAIITALVLALVGYTMGTDALVTMLTLTTLEITFSLDNAVVNATVLQRMNQFWQRMFMTVGIIIAVFGMRLLFPLLLVSATSGLNVQDVFSLALQHPAEYTARLTQAEPAIAAFGGMFLLMIFLGFLFDESRNAAKVLHRTLRSVGLRKSAEVFTALAVLACLVVVAPAAVQFSVAVAGIFGVATHLVVGVVADTFAGSHTARGRQKAVGWKAGLVTFLYLELLDASFSFDSVIGAFAITANAVLIVAGLGAGALWVRSITIYLVRHGTLARLPYLNAGAHYAIGALAAMLLLGIQVDLPDTLTGSTGLVIIGLAFAASVWKNRRLKAVAKPAV